MHVLATFLLAIIVNYYAWFKPVFKIKYNFESDEDMRHMETSPTK